jgi:hypothetical protein
MSKKDRIEAEVSAEQCEIRLKVSLCEIQYEGTDPTEIASRLWAIAQPALQPVINAVLQELTSHR